MELISVYIEESKAVKRLLLPLNSNFNILYDNETLTIRQNYVPQNQYYKNISFNLLLGENGTGKTTILDYIESLLCDSSDMGFSIWFDGIKYHIFDFFNIIKYIKSDHPYQKTEIIKKALVQQNVSALKISNVFDLNKYAISSSNNNIKNQRIIDLTNNSLLRSSKNNIVKNDLKNEFSYVENIFTNFTSSDKDKPEFIFSLKKGSNFTKIIKISDDYPKTLTGEIENFNETIGDSINHPEYRGFFEWNNKNSEAQYLDFRDILDLIFYKDEEDKNITDEYIFTLIAPSIFRSAIRTIKFPYELQKSLNQDDTTPSDLIAEDREVILINMLFEYYLKSKRINNVETIEDAFVNNFIHYRYDYVLSDSEKSEIKHLFIEKYTRGLSELVNCISNLVNSKVIDITHTPKEVLLNIPNYKISKNLIKFLSLCTPTVQSQFSYGWAGMSSGEAAKLKILSRMNYGILAQRKSLKSNSLSHIILIDEIDLYIHPEWQRIIVKEIIEYINEIRLPNEQFKFIITTHSPIVASDILPDDIICLYKDNSTIKMRDTTFGFGTSISELYYNSFSLSSTIGEYSKITIDDIISRSNSNRLNEEDVILINKIGENTVKEILLKRVKTND